MLIFLIYLVENSTPIVVEDLKLNSFLVKRVNKFDFPTPESPTNTTLNNTYLFILGIFIIIINTFV